MIQKLANPTLVQRIARGFAIGLCGMLAVGVLGATADRQVDRAASRSSEAVATPPVAMAAETPKKSSSAKATSPRTNPNAVAFANAFSPTRISSIERTRDELLQPMRPGRASASRDASTSRVVWMEVTAYCACKRCCGPEAQGLTASGKRVSYNKSRFVAADTDVLPFGTKLSIPGYHGGKPVEVVDRGSAIKGNKLDVFFPSHQIAKKWGRQWVPVTVMN